MAQYTLKVHIDDSQYPTLKQSNYRLCIAKMVNNSYTVVWFGGDFLQDNSFRWTEEYEVFGEETFDAGAVVELTKSQPIKSGQTCEMTVDGDLKPATGAPDTSGAFAVKNEFGAIHVGVSASLGDKFLPIYVSPIVVSGDVALQPAPTVKVWFDLNLKTSSMIVGSGSNSIEVAFEGNVEQSITFQGPKPGLGSWVLSGSDSA